MRENKCEGLKKWRKVEVSIGEWEREKERERVSVMDSKSKNKSEWYYCDLLLHTIFNCIQSN